MKLVHWPLMGGLLHLVQRGGDSSVILGERTDADKRMNPLHFGSNPADIRIRINPGIRIRIADHFC